MKIAHLTDLHVMRPPRPAELLGKRLIGSANLYLMGRKGHFDARAQQAAVDAALAERPDLVLISGDLTAQALESEFEAARALLDPLLRAAPAVIISGNHDTYVASAVRQDLTRRWFGSWMGQGTPALLRFGDVAVLTLETCRAHLLSSGYAPPDQLPRAAALLQALEPPLPFVFLLMHYPLRNRRGQPYGPATRNLSNAAEVEAWLLGQPRVGAVVHGHEHHGFRAQLARPGGDLPILDPGASGYALLPDKGRTAHLNLYEADGDGLHGVRRLAWDGAAFVEEPGGAYATGG